jgi:hypothetical protein
MPDVDGTDDIVEGGVEAKAPFLSQGFGGDTISRKRRETLNLRSVTVTELGNFCLPELSSVDQTLVPSQCSGSMPYRMAMLHQYNACLKRLMSMKFNLLFLLHALTNPRLLPVHIS